MGYKKFITFVIVMAENKLKISAADTFNRYLAAKHLRRTPERYAILDMVLQMNKHFYIETICRAMDESSFRVSRATVYNTIGLLTDAGILRRHRFGNEPAQFEKIVDTAAANHQHLVCTKCGKVKEIKDMALLKALSQHRYQAFTPEYFQFYVYGTCSQCSRRMKHRNKN